MEFKQFTDVITTQFNYMLKEGKELYSLDIPKETLWESYLNAFPFGTNIIFNEKREFDCNTCKNFIRDVGNAVTIINGQLVSVWDITIDNSIYQTVANTLAQFTRTAPIKNIFTNYEVQAGAIKTHQQLPDGKVQAWYHFNGQVPKHMVDRTPENLAYARTSTELLGRAMNEFTLDAINTIIELIAQGSLYKGDEFKDSITALKQLKIQYEALDGVQQHIFLWENYSNKYTRIKNTVLGTLLEDISSGKELEYAVKSYEDKTAPTNYKRPTALITQGMIDKAMETINTLGIESALHRRFAIPSDISINNVLFADRSITPSMKDGIASLLTKEVKHKPIDLTKVEEISINDFITNVLPNITSLQVLFKNKNKSNLVSLIAPQDTEAKGIMKWDNNFSWNYTGNITDSLLAQQVRAAGGRTDGVLRFTHSWNHEGQNQSLMDLHVFLPGHDGQPTTSKHNKYGNTQRVGWNQRQHPKTKGIQDVDYTEAPGKSIPIENITFPEMQLLPEGKYVFKVHNWSHRNPTTQGFKAEIAFGNEVYSYDYKPAMANQEWVTVAEATLLNGQFTITHHIPHGDTAVKAWNINTENFHKVSMLTISPNHWDKQEIGNKHYFFILDDCLSDEEPRGFYNEFLSNDLEKHKKVFEVLGNKTTCPMSDTQLSGLGFSTTQRNSVICKVSGTFTRMLKINF